MSPNFSILYEDNHLLVVDKPPLIATMGAAPGQESLVDVLKAYLGRKYQKPGKVYLGIVSRLDAWVSGVIVFARTSKAAERLNQQFCQRSCQKTYLAIVPDRSDFKDTGRLEHRLAKDESLHRMTVVASSDKFAHSNSIAQFASLTYRTLGRSHRYRLLEVDLETGRKHQIRVQLWAEGCPIVGDQKYDSKESFAKGIALHSFRLRIEHPTKKILLAFEAIPPEYWQLSRFGFKP
jgi:23S rRNA pseudouridine1911/1915/1917 synthase